MSEAGVVASIWVGGLALLVGILPRLRYWLRTSPTQARWDRAAKARRRAERRASDGRR